MSVSIELMANEKSSVFLNMAAVGVADIFEGASPPVEFLAKRCGEMLRANPWLAGRLRTVDGRGHSRILRPVRQQQIPRVRREFCLCPRGAVRGRPPRP